MAPIPNRQYQDETGDYQLPNDGPEHDRLDEQSASIIALMNNKPFHAPISRPKRILDIGCGTGVMTNLLAAVYPDAEVIGVDIAVVPESRHGKRSNVEYIHGDIRELAGVHGRLQLGSFDYVFQRMLVFGMTRWESFVALATSLVGSGGWLESQEATMELWSAEGRCVSNDWLWYQRCLSDSRKIGIDIEIGRKLQGIYLGTASLQYVSESVYSFAPKPREETPQLVGLEGEIEQLFSLVVAKICALKRSEIAVRDTVQDLRTVWVKGFNDSDRFHMHAVIGQRV